MGIIDFAAGYALGGKAGNQGIDEFIAAQGYRAYTRANVEGYESAARDGPEGVLAL